LSSCERFAIIAKQLADLAPSFAPVRSRLDYTGAILPRPVAMTETQFRWALNEDAMATEKLAEGIRNFTVDQIKLEKTLAERLG